MANISNTDYGLVINHRTVNQETKELQQRSDTWWKTVCSRLSCVPARAFKLDQAKQLQEKRFKGLIGFNALFGPIMREACISLSTDLIERVKAFQLTRVSEADSATLLSLISSQGENIELLSFDIFHFTKAASAHLLNILRQGRLRELILSKSKHVSPNFLKELLSIPNLNLVTLNLSSIGLNEDHSKYISNFISWNSNLEILVLKNNQLGTEGASNIIQSLSSNDRLRLLDLDSNLIFSSISTLLHDLILSGSNIRLLSLSNNSIDRQGIERILNALRIRKLYLTLQYLRDNLKDFNKVSNISQNKKEKSKKLKKGIKSINNNTINELILDNNIDELDVIQELYSILDTQMMTILEITKKNELTWSKHAWLLASSEFGPKIIKEYIGLLLQSYENEIYRVVKERNSNQETILEVLLKNKFINEEVAEAIKYICIQCHIKPDNKDSLNRPYIDVMRQHENKNIRKWSNELGAIDGKYKFTTNPPLSLSSSGEILIVERVKDDKQVIMKIYRNIELYQKEISIRNLLLNNLKAMDINRLDRNIIGNRKNFDIFAKQHKNETQVSKRIQRQFVIPLRSNSNKESKYIYCIFDKAEKSLFQVMNSEKIAGIDLIKITKIMKRAALSLYYINSCGITHGQFKPKSFLRMESDTFDYRLVDFTSATPHGEEMKGRMSQSYIPPEAAYSKFVVERRVENNELPLIEEVQQKMKVIASEKFDVWSFGVVLFEVLSGLSLFESLKASDKLASSSSKADLINWLEIPSSQLERILEIPENTLKTKQVFFARELVRWCLQRDPDKRPTFNEILEHPFFTAADESKVDLSKNFKTHLFLSHIQSQASGTVKDLYYCSAQLGCSAWLDMKAGQITQQAMYDGVQNTEAFIVCVTKDIFYSKFCLKEFMWALDFKKKIILLEEVDPRQHLFPFNKEEFIKKFQSKDNMKWLCSVLGTFDSLMLNGFILEQVESSSNKIETEYNGNVVQFVLIEVVFKNILKLLESDRCIPYRRREYENVAMMNHLLETIGFIPPNDAILDERDQIVSEEVNKMISKVEQDLDFLDDEVRDMSFELQRRKASFTSFTVGVPLRKFGRGRNRKGLSKIEKHKRKVKHWKNKSHKKKKQQEQKFRFRRSFASKDRERISEASLLVPETRFPNQIFVLIGHGNKDYEMANSLKATITEYIDFGNINNQWLEYGPNQEISFEEMKRATSVGKIAIVCLVSPGYFTSTVHGSNLLGLEKFLDEQKEKVDFPVIMVQEGFFARAWNEIEAEVGDKYNHYLLDVELMPYRAPNLRRYEHYAMVGEVANRINIFCDVYAA